MTKTNTGKSSDDPFDLNRFINAQADIYATALAELRSGRKRTHWMWFIFPQIAGLGRSATTQLYAIQSLEEARQYLADPILGAHLLECTQAVLAVQDRTVSEIFPYPDDLKLKSCMTLFASITEPDAPFSQLLKKYFGGERDEKTLQLVTEQS